MRTSGAVPVAPPPSAVGPNPPAARSRSRRTSHAQTLAFAVAPFVLLAAVVGLPLSEFTLRILTLALIYAVVAASWDLLIGYAGQLSFGHAALFGVGAYGGALTSGELGLSPWLGLPVGGLCATIIGLVFGLPALRVRGPYLALTTLGLMSVVQVVIQNWDSVTGGHVGYFGFDPLPGIPSGGAGFYVFVVAYACLMIVAMYWLGQHSRIGLRWRALRDDERRAETLGLNTTSAKLSAFAVSAFAAGTAGAVYAQYVTVVTPTAVSFNMTAIFVAMAIVGGRGTIFGGLVGALVYQAGSQYARTLGVVYSDMATGLLLVVVVWLWPQGVLGLLRRAWPWPRTHDKTRREETTSSE